MSKRIVTAVLPVVLSVFSIVLAQQNQLDKGIQLTLAASTRKQRKSTKKSSKRTSKMLRLITGWVSCFCAGFRTKMTLWTTSSARRS